MFVGVKAEELAVGGYIDFWVLFFLKFSLQMVVTAAKPIWEKVGHRNQLGRTIFTHEGIFGSAGAAPSAANQGQLNSVVFCGMNRRDGQSGQRRGRSDLACRLHHVTTRRIAFGSLRHDGSPPHWGKIGRKEASEASFISFSDLRQKSITPTEKMTPMS